MILLTYLDSQNSMVAALLGWDILTQHSRCARRGLHTTGTEYARVEAADVNVVGKKRTPGMGRCGLAFLALWAGWVGGTHTHAQGAVAASMNISLGQAALRSGVSESAYVIR